MKLMRSLVLLSALLLGGAVSNAKDATRPPNVILILADDLGYGDLGCYGQKHFATPNIDRLAATGIRFTQHYSGSSVCAPARSALMTGLHTGHTPIRGNLEVKPEGQTPLPAGTTTLAGILKAGGYATGVFGKWGLGFPASEGDPLRQGFDRFYGYNCQRLGHNYYPDHLWDNDRRLMLPDNSGGAQGSYAPALIHAQTLAFIAANKDRPFFCYVATVIPHAELAVPECYLARQRGKHGPETPFKGTDSGPEYRQGPYSSQTEPHAAYAAMIELLDEQVGQIVAEVQRLGIADDTIIVFASDNGPSREGGSDPAYFGSSGGLRGGKRDLYEGGIRVPLIASWPGEFSAGVTTDTVSAFWDMLPTLAELCGQQVPQGLDGLSLAPALTGRGKQTQHKYLYWEFHEAGGRVALRQGDWKVVRYNVLQHPDGPLELYHLGEDPMESRNVAGLHPEVVSRLDELLRSARTESAIFKFSNAGYLQKQ